jgi:type II secretory pathway component PulL
VWPYFAELPLATLTPAQQVELDRLVSPAEAKAMRTAGKWGWWRLAIGAAGTWLSFGR